MLTVSDIMGFSCCSCRERERGRENGMRERKGVLERPRGRERGRVNGMRERKGGEDRQR